MPQYFFELTYTKAFITKKQIVDPDIESRIAEINQILASDEYYSLHKYNHHYKKGWLPFRYSRQIRHKVKNALQDYDESDYDRKVYNEVKY
ncbi:MAG: hypothetical protein WBA74_01545 [Cyclobacteriaceae bacterium]